MIAPLVSTCKDQLVIVGDLADAGLLNAVGNAAHRGIDRIDRDQADRRIFRAVGGSRLVTAAGADGEFHAERRAIIQRAEHQIRVHDLDVVAGLDLPGFHFARAGRGQHHALRPLAMHAHGELLDVQHDVGHVLAHAGERREFMQHAVDPHGGDGRALQRGQQNPAQRIAQRHAEAALQRLGDNGGHAAGIRAKLDIELLRLDQHLPIALQRQI